MQPTGCIFLFFSLNTTKSNPIEQINFQKHFNKTLFFVNLHINSRTPAYTGEAHARH